MEDESFVHSIIGIGQDVFLHPFPSFRDGFHPHLLDTGNLSAQGICFTQREELFKERLGAFVSGVDIFLIVEPLFCLPQQGEGKQTKLDDIGSDTPYHYDVTELQKVMHVCIGVLIRLTAKRASLHYVDKARLELKIHVPNIDIGSGSNIGYGGDRELTKSLLSLASSADGALILLVTDSCVGERSEEERCEVATFS